MICPSQAATIGFDLCPPCFADMGGQFIYHLFLKKLRSLGKLEKLSSTTGEKLI